MVNCEGLCPGLNDAIHHIVEQLSYVYGVERIYGIRGGYRGFDSTTPLDEGQRLGQHPRALHDPEGLGEAMGGGGGGGGDGSLASKDFAPVRLTPKMVATGTTRANEPWSARGGFDEDKIVAFLEKNRINQLYVIGGDGTPGRVPFGQGLRDQGLNGGTACPRPSTTTSR